MERKYIFGECSVRITSADIGGLFEVVTKKGLELSDVAFLSDLAVEMRIPWNQYSELCEICDTHGARLELLRKEGVVWKLFYIVKRPVLILGVMLLALAALVTPGRVWFITVEGNVNVPANRILESAENAGIRFGASRREVRSERVKNSLLEDVPQLQWAGINTSGCVATISVRERNEEEKQEIKIYPSSIVSYRDGVIISCTASDGILLCQEGQIVHSGDVLISGYVDTGLCIRVTRAEGEVYAQTRHELQAIMPVAHIQKGEQVSQKKNVSLIFGKKRINLWKDSGISDGVCGRMYEEYYITLPGGFSLPVALAVETITVWNPVLDDTQETIAKAYLELFLSDYLCSQMIAGRIQNTKTIFLKSDGTYLLEGEFVCTEMIGRERKEQIGEYHE